MLWFFGQVWALCLISFLIGVLLNSLVNSLVVNKPLRRRNRALEKRVKDLESALAQRAAVEQSALELPDWATDAGAYQQASEPPVAPSHEEPPVFPSKPNEHDPAAQPQGYERWLRQQSASHGIDPIEMELSDPAPEGIDSPTGPISAKVIREADRRRNPHG